MHMCRSWLVAVADTRGPAMCRFPPFQGSLGKNTGRQGDSGSASWGDQIGFLPGDKPLLTAEKFTKQFREYKELGVDTVLFRLDVLRWVRDYNWPEPRLHYKNAPPDIVEYDQKQWAGARQGVKENLLARIVEIAHAQGLKIFAYSTNIDEECPSPRTGTSPASRADRSKHKEGVLFQARPEQSDGLEVHRGSPRMCDGGSVPEETQLGKPGVRVPEARSYVVGYKMLFENYPFHGCISISGTSSHIRSSATSSGLASPSWRSIKGVNA